MADQQWYGMDVVQSQVFGSAVVPIQHAVPGPQQLRFQSIPTRASFAWSSYLIYQLSSTVLAMARSSISLAVPIKIASGCRPEPLPEQKQFATQGLQELQMARYLSRLS
mmetsp:Transcript_43672/g.72580  ORF Transcript_43672/g.72580 Transcript_43672/m.72580 type:complete len:109 (-) Transcript_43672:1746-2072(-)